MTSAPLGIGFIGSGCITRFHIQVRGVMRRSSLDSGLEFVPQLARGTWTP